MTKFAPRHVSTIVVEMQTRRYREMSPAEKLALADRLWDLAWDATRAGIRMRRPELSETAVAAQARDLMRRAPD